VEAHSASTERASLPVDECANTQGGPTHAHATVTTTSPHTHTHTQPHTHKLELGASKLLISPYAATAVTAAWHACAAKLVHRRGRARVVRHGATHHHSTAALQVCCNKMTKKTFFVLVFL